MNLSGTIRQYVWSKIDDYKKEVRVIKSAIALCSVSCNLFRNPIARQVARYLVQCDRAIRMIKSLFIT